MYQYQFTVDHVRPFDLPPVPAGTKFVARLKHGDLSDSTRSLYRIECDNGMAFTCRWTDVAQDAQLVAEA